MPVPSLQVPALDEGVALAREALDQVGPGNPGHGALRHHVIRELHAAGGHLNEFEVFRHGREAAHVVVRSHAGHRAD